MTTISQLTGTGLHWKQPHMNEPSFELTGNEGALAKLHFKNSFGSYAEGEVDGQVWTFKRQGFLNTYVAVRKKGAEANIAVYKNNTWSGGGTLELPDGRKYPANSNFWSDRFEFSSESGKPLIQYTHITGFKLHAQLEVLPGAALLDDIPWILLLGWYLAVMASREGELVAGLF